MSSNEAGGNGKLRVGEAVTGALTALFSNIPALIKISWPWLLLVGGASYVVTMQFADWIANTPHQAGVPTVPVPAHINGLNVLLQVFALLAGAVMAVGWHRLVLLGERASFASALPGRTALRYVGVVFLIVLATVLPTVILIGFGLGLFGTLAPMSGPIAAVLALLALIAIVVAFVLALRLSMVLPARSIGDNALRLRDSFAGTRGNTTRLLFGALLSLVVPLVMLQIVLLPLFGGMTTPTATGPEAMAQAIRQFAVPSAIFTVLTMMISMMFVSFLSSAYKHLFADRMARVMQGHAA